MAHQVPVSETLFLTRKKSHLKFPEAGLNEIPIIFKLVLSLH